ncbi:UNKNOWN [Stylonychia lemnae]|uniref:RCC1-like domain-containing protein n=1 Tax=Stylonychia lemnae TaxID=5949 RepID=A0A078B3Z9_STYLE|nr:UNKNOWN [Stylonychia lemnae]|eukprot:CDW87912.1 UNKNOWN [Stylonychia lemnae]
MSNLQTSTTYQFSRQHQFNFPTTTNESNEFEKSVEKKHKKTKQKSSQARSQKPKGATCYEFTEVFVWGDDRWGQLGLYHQKIRKGYHDQTSFKIPKTCSFNILIKQISCGDAHSAILTNQGHLYMMGSNIKGQLGIGDNCPDLQNRDCAGAPCLVDSLRDYKVDKVVCGWNHTIAIVNDKQRNSIEPDMIDDNQFIFVWGSNEQGQLGIPLQGCIDLPVRQSFFEHIEVRVKDIYAGYQHTLYVTENGQVYSTGSNSFGQLGLGQQELFINQPVLIEGILDRMIIKAAAGEQHSLFLSKEGEVYACGSNQQNQLGIPEVQNLLYTPQKLNNLQNYRIQEIQARSHSAAISNQGELFLWGLGVFGQYRTPQKILTISNPVKNISLGGTVGSAVDVKGLLWTWGTNGFGELGVGDNDPRIHPYPVLTLKGKTVTQISCGGQYVIALGSNIKKEIPGLKLKKSRENSLQKTRKSSAFNKNSSQKSMHQRSLSHGKQKNSSSSFILRKESVGSSDHIIYGQERIDTSTRSLPKSKSSGGQSRLIKKRDSRGSINKSKDVIPKSKGKSKKQKVGKISSSVPFSGEETTVIKPNKLNTSGIIVKNKNKLLITNYKEQGISNQSDLLNQNHSKKLQQQLGFQQNINQIELNTSNQNTNESQSEFMYIPQPLLSTTNKEKLIKELTQENKMIRQEHEQLKKDSKYLKHQMENFEKQYEKSKIGQAHQQEIQGLYQELKKKESKITSMRERKTTLKQAIEELQAECKTLKSQKVESDVLVKDLKVQMEQLKTQNQEIQSRYEQSEQRNNQQEKDMVEIQMDIKQISDHSKDVERDLLDKLHQISEKYRLACVQIDDLQTHQKQDKKKIDEMQYQVKDHNFYTSALEKENQFLREEVEKVKYSKDKNEYSKFLQNLVPIRGMKLTSSSYGKNNQDQQVNNENNCSFNRQVEQPAKSPFKDQTMNLNQALNKAENYLKESQFGISTPNREPQILQASQMRMSEFKIDRLHNEEQQQNMNSSFDRTSANNQMDDTRMSYNQKLLKSIEKRTQRDNKFR